MVEPRYFLPMSTKKFFFFLKMERKLKGKIKHHFWTKMPICSCTWACPHWSSSFFFSFFFFFFFPLDVASFCFLFSFDLEGRLHTCLVLIFFLFFLLLSFMFFFFFSRHDFYFLINLDDWFFFFLVVYHFFGFNWVSFFNKGICVNLYKLTFSILLLFYS